MDLYTLTKTLIRRWYIVLPVLGLALWTANRTLDAIEPTYEARGSVLLLLPNVVERGDEQQLRNPYTEHSRAIVIAAEVIERAVTEGPWRSVIVEEGLSRDFETSAESNSPIILVEAQASDPEIASATVARVFEALSAELQVRQERSDAPEIQRIRMETLFGPTEGSRVTVQENRAMAAMIALAVIATIAAAMVAESWSAGRRAERERRLRERAAAPPPSTAPAAAAAEPEPPPPAPGPLEPAEPSQEHGAEHSGPFAGAPTVLASAPPERSPDPDPVDGPPISLGEGLPPHREAPTREAALEGLAAGGQQPHGGGKLGADPSTEPPRSSWAPARAEERVPAEPVDLRDEPANPLTRPAPTGTSEHDGLERPEGAEGGGERATDPSEEDADRAEGPDDDGELGPMTPWGWLVTSRRR